jgi:predicted dienelactone hydrolase
VVVPRLPILVVVAACGSHGNANSLDAASAQDATRGSDSAPGDSAIGADPAGDGPSSVATQTASISGATTGRKVPATIFVPTPANHALVVVSPGFQMQRTQYVSYAQHLATWGYTVVLTDYADTSLFADHQKLADDVGAVITFALAQTALGLDADKVGVAGHSLGGDISTLAAAGDARIKSIVGWDPVDASSPSVVPEKMGSVHAALAVIGETTNASGGGMPCAPAAENFQQFYAAAASPALAMTVTGADHMDWVDDPSCGFCGFCTAGSADAALARTATKRLDVAWFGRTLLGDATMDPWLTSPPEVAAGTASVVRK